MQEKINRFELAKLINMTTAASLNLARCDQACIAQALLSPPKPAPALERAFARRNKLLRRPIPSTCPQPSTAIPPIDFA